MTNNNDYSADGKKLFEMLLLKTMDEKTKKAYKVCRKYGIKPEDYIPFLMELGVAIGDEQN